MGARMVPTLRGVHVPHVRERGGVLGPDPGETGWGEPIWGESAEIRRRTRDVSGALYSCVLRNPPQPH